MDCCMGHVSGEIALLQCLSVIQVMAIKSNLIPTSWRNSMQSKGDLFYDDHILRGEKRKL